MESNRKRILRETLLDLYEKADEEERRMMVNLYLTELDERTLRSYSLLWSHGITPNQNKGP